MRKDIQKRKSNTGREKIEPKMATSLMAFYAMRVVADAMADQ
jgi:hypothetical protein